MQLAEARTKRWKPSPVADEEEVEEEVVNYNADLLNGAKVLVFSSGSSDSEADLAYADEEEAGELLYTSHRFSPDALVSLLEAVDEKRVL